MTNPQALVARTPPRTLAPDLSRGIMLLAIAIANSTWYLWGHPGSLLAVHPTDGGLIDRIIRAVMVIAVDGRIYPLFAFLFGYGMVQFARNRTARGLPPPEIKRRLTRRHLWMLVFGFAHAVLLYAGDILGAYGLLGLILVVALFESRIKTLVIVFWALVAYTAVTAVMTLVTMWQIELMNIDLTMSDPSLPIPTLRDLFSGQPGYLLAMLTRAVIWVVTTCSIPLAGTLPAAILMGWILARQNVLESPAAHVTALRRQAVGGIAVGWLLGVPGALAELGYPVMSAGMLAGWLSLSYLGGLFCGLGYAAALALFAMWLQQRGIGPISRAIAAVGKRSLSSYLLQSIIMAPLLAAWGFGLGSRLHTSGVVLVAIGTWLVSLIVAVLLERSGRTGPAEVLLRRLSAGRDHSRARETAATRSR